MARSGDRQAFDALVREASSLIYNLSYRLTGNSSDAKDLWQESVIKAYQRLSEFKGRSSFSSWLYRIAVNEWKDKMRQEQNDSTLFLESIDRVILVGEDEVSMEVQDMGHSPAEALFSKQRCDVVLDMIGRLDKHTRMVVVLALIEGKSYQETAELAGCSVRTVNRKITSVREMIRRKLHYD